MTTISEQINQTAATELVQLWGGRLPTWEEFKQASKEGRVRVNKSLANNLIFSPAVPKAHRIMFGLITLYAGFLAPLLAIVFYFWKSISGWWIAGSFVLAWYLVKVARDGQCDGLRYGAAENEQFYSALIVRGAFLFGPK